MATTARTPRKTAATKTAAKTPATAPAAAQCLCGCGLRVAPRRSWLPGHDARAAGVAARAALTGDTAAIQALPSEALRTKAANLAARWEAAAKDKADRAAERAAAREAKLAAAAK